MQASACRTASDRSAWQSVANPNVAGMAGSPFFCMITQVTMYLNGLLRRVRRFMQLSKHSVVHWPTCIRHMTLG